MKNIKKLIYSALLIGGLTSCNALEDFGDTNVNPGAVTSPVYGALLTNVQSGLGSYAYQATPALYAQYFSETQYTEASRYQTPANAFTGYYSGHLNDLQNIIDNSGNNNLNAIATILQQYIFLFVTDHWGDVPYSEALQGTNALLPAYDRQEDIYRGAFEKLGAAVASFDNSPIAGDIIFNGNLDAWRRTANSLKLIAALQLSKRVPASDGFAAQAFREALAATGGVITSNAQNLQINYPGGNFQSPYFSRYLTRSDYAQSKTLTDLTAALNDNRQSVFGGASNTAGSTASSNIGVPYGLDREPTLDFTGVNPTWARILRGDKRVENSPVYIITAAQVALARAEAADLGWTTENLSDLYAQGISLSFAQWDVAYDAAYLTNSQVALSSPAGSNANLRQISTQRYIASYPDGYQGWNIWRKSGYPVLVPSPDPLSSSGQIPRRYVYTPAEILSNPDNAAVAIANLSGGNSQDARIWWDVE